MAHLIIYMIHLNIDFFSSSDRCLCDRVKYVSSANNVVENSDASGKSLIYKIKSSGPKGGTPYLIFLIVDFEWKFWCIGIYC